MSVPSGVRTAGYPRSNLLFLRSPITGPLADQVFNYSVAKEKGEDASKEKDPPEDCFRHGSKIGIYSPKTSENLDLIFC